MNRTVRLLVAVTSLALLQGCVFAVIHGTKYAYREYAKQDKAVNAALQQVQALRLSGDRARLAQLFDTSAEWSEVGATEIVGRDAILEMLLPPGAAPLSELRFTVTSTRMLADGAVQSGSYREAVPTSTGASAAGQGRFNVRWSHQADGRWTIARWRQAPNAVDDPFAEPVIDRGS